VAGAYIGGISGIAMYSLVENCYAIGDASDWGNGFEGAIAGYGFIPINTDDRTRDDPTNNIIASFWDIITTNKDTGFGYLNPEATAVTVAGKLTTEMKTPSTFLESGWDFDNIWDIDSEINNGYPHLRGNEPTPPPLNDNDKVTSIKPKLYTNYPNPFNPETTIMFSISPLRRGQGEGSAYPLLRRGQGEGSHVNISIYNIKGQKVRELINDYFTSGTHSIIWNGTNDNEQPVASGVYFYRLKTGNFTATRKMLLLK
jgi:hypothetical protein